MTDAQVNTSGLDTRMGKLRNVTNSLPEKVVARVALFCEGEMKRESPIQTGRLRSSIEARIFGRRATVGTSVKYAAAVALGAKPHRITPRDKLALSWPGGPGPRRSVNHPGNKPNPFHLRAMSKTKEASSEIADQVIAEETVGV